MKLEIMKKLRFSILTSLLLLLSISIFAGVPPAKVQVAFKKMYPKVVKVEWSKKGGYHIADFTMNNYEIDVWFSAKAQWVMTETDVEALGAIPVPVAKAFMESTMASLRLEDVRIITFPKHPTVIVIEVEAYNFDEEFQLFYAPDGTLLRTLNVSNTGAEIYPELFE